MMLLNVVKDHPSKMIDRWGLSSELKVTLCEDQELEEVSQRFVERATEQASLTPDRWLELRKDCSKCAMIQCCGSRFLPENGASCPDETRQLVRVVMDAGLELRDMAEE